MTVNVAELLALPKDFRAELAELLLQSLHGELDFGLSEEHLAELEQYVAEYRANPEEMISWEEVKAQALRRV
jgi:putative addiction module component (TIGR02574 family)